MQQCADIYLLQSLYTFRVSQHPSSGALKTVTATSGIGHNTGTATSFQRGLIRTLHIVIPDGCVCSIQFSFDVLIKPRWKEVAVPVL